MLKIWKGFVLGNNKSFPQIEDSVRDEEIKCDGKYGALPVTHMDTSKPRVIFVGGMISLTSGEIRPNQVLKVYSYLEGGGINPSDINLYLPIYNESTDPKIANEHQLAYKDSPLTHTSAYGEQLSQFVFSDQIIPDLDKSSPEVRAQAVEQLKLMASQTTFLGFSFGPTLIEDMFNNLVTRFENKHWQQDEIQEVVSSLLSYHVAPVNPIAEKPYNLPQVNNMALNDKTARVTSNYNKLVDRKQHPVMLDKMLNPDTLLLATTDLPGTYSTMSLTSHLPTERAKLYATVFEKDEHGNPDYKSPVGKNYMRLQEKKYPDRHGFDPYTAVTRVVREEYNDPRQTSFVLSTFGINPMAKPFLESVARGITASIESARTGTTRNSQKIISETQKALTPDAKNRIVIETAKDIVEERMTGRFAERYNAFADRLLVDEFPAWATNDSKTRDAFLSKFDERANKVFTGEDSLETFLKWSRKYTERSGRLPGMD